MSDDEHLMQQQDYDIPKLNELRIEIGNEPISIVLLHGTAEIFGHELITKMEYNQFLNTSIAIFTFLGCCIKIIGTPNECYIPENFIPKAVMQAVNLHAAFSRVKTGNLMIVGPPNCGKLTLSKHLLNYAARETVIPITPIFIDLNVEINSISSLPGSIGCGKMNKPCWNLSFGLDEICLLHFGHSSIKKNPEFFKSQCESLYKLLLLKNKNKMNLIITTPSKISIGENQYYDFILDLANIFQIDCLLVMEDQGLFQRFKKDSKLQTSITTIFFDKFCGTIEKKNKKNIQEQAIQKYFASFLPLQKPFYSRLTELQIIRIMTSEISNSCLPIGKERLGKDMFHQEIVDDHDLSSCIGSIIYNEDEKQEEDYKQPILGFAYIKASGPHNVNIVTIDDLPFLPCKLLLSDFKF